MYNDKHLIPYLKPIFSKNVIRRKNTYYLLDIPLSWILLLAD